MIIYRITTQGYYLGRNTPADFNISEEVYQILKAQGVPIIKIDTQDIERANTEAKLKQEKMAKEAYEANLQKLADKVEFVEESVEEDATFEVLENIISEQLDEKMNARIEELENRLAEQLHATDNGAIETVDDTDEEINSLLENEPVESSFDVIPDVVKNENSKNETKSDHIYTEDELAALTKDQLVAILIARGHNNARVDKLSAKSIDRRPAIIEKIIATNPIE